MITTSIGGELALAFGVFFVEMLLEGGHIFGSVVLEAPIVEREIEHSRGFEGVDRQAYGNAIGDLVLSTVRKLLGGDNALPQVFNFIVIS
jgi:hypothetical protein